MSKSFARRFYHTIPHVQKLINKSENPLTFINAYRDLEKNMMLAYRKVFESVVSQQPSMFSDDGDIKDDIELYEEGFDDEGFDE